jgi:hypothetical protein
MRWEYLCYPANEPYLIGRIMLLLIIQLVERSLPIPRGTDVAAGLSR